MSAPRRVRGTSWWDRWMPIWHALRSVMPRLRRRHVPVMLQLSAVECSAACLAMILNFYGRKTSIAECRECVGVGRDGVTAQTIAKGARTYGLRVKAYSLEPTNFPYVRLPAIVHWNFNHFVIVERWSPKSVEIVDPAAGRRRLSTEEFDASFTGVVLTFEPGDHFERRRTSAQPSLYQHLLAYLLHTPGLLIQILAASLVLQILGLALPVFTKVLVDQILPFQIDNVMPILGIGLVILILTQVVIGYLRSALLIFLQARIDIQLMLGFFKHLLSLPLRFFEQRASGDLLTRLGSNMLIRETLTNQAMTAVLDGTLVLGYLALLLSQDLFFGGLVLVVGLLQVAMLLGTRRQVHALMQRDLAAGAESQSYLVEALTGIATLKASGAEDRAHDHWSNLFFNQTNISLQRNHLAAIVETALTTLRTFSPLALLWFGALRVLDGTMSLGTMLALNALAAAVLTPLASLVMSGQRLQLVGAYLERLADVLEAEPEQDLEGAQPAPQLDGRIELTHVNFRYAPNAPVVVRDISITIEPGQKVAIVGRTGSGKSTLVKLLLGLYTPTEGDIRYDGQSLLGLNRRTLRSQIGVVLQEPFLFSGSIRQNIAFNDPGLSLEQVMAAARLAAIDDEILQLPMGYETLIAEGGSGLSGGQRQRLALARAVAQKPAILVLDEATSHLDVVTESLVDRNLSHLACTRIVIAHRLSTIRNADVILVLDEGTIVERGSHEELLARSGYYTALVHSQLQDQAAEAGLT